MELNKDTIKNLYSKNDSDETVGTFNDAVGISIVRNYTQNSEYFRDGMKMMIRFYLKGEDMNLMGSVDMVKPEKEDNGTIQYIIKEGNQYKKKVTGFHFQNEGLNFDKEKGIIKWVKKSVKKEFSVNQVVEILVKNHLQDKLFWKRKINTIVDWLLKLIFWFSDKSYDGIKVIAKMHNTRNSEEHDKNEDAEVEPFFKYFKISKNTLLAFSLILLAFSIYFFKMLSGEEYSAASPIIILSLFVFLSFLDKFSVRLNKKIKGFFKNEQNLIWKMHYYKYTNKFSLRF